MVFIFHFLTFDIDSPIPPGSRLRRLIVYLPCHIVTHAIDTTSAISKRISLSFPPLLNASFRPSFSHLQNSESAVAAFSAEVAL
jgi:hypothetical protein